MQFTSGTPDIPDHLVQAHEEGRVVFFCGAGISYPAGLGNFKWLTKELHEKLVGRPVDPEDPAFKDCRFEDLLHQLEMRTPKGRQRLRAQLTEILTPNTRRPNALRMHASLLTLARQRDGKLRLVTTNYDHLFEIAARRAKLRLKASSAPLLPVPNVIRWDGLVYLHGVLPDKKEDTDEKKAALEHLVLTSGDFGRAYLVERWAARFVSELFKNFTVCFVGYSINDRVMRYMMDALAADRELAADRDMGDAIPQAWAFAPRENVEDSEKAWGAKSVEPIFYDVKARRDCTEDHTALQETIQAWADAYRDGISGKSSIIVTHAGSPPALSTQEDDFAGRVLWALSDPTGIPAKDFAALDPVPPLDWLNAFEEKRYGHNDLARFGIREETQSKNEPFFSLIERPAPYQLAPPMSLFASSDACGWDKSNGACRWDKPIDACRWDKPMAALAKWLVRHIGDPELLLRFARRGGQIHKCLVRQIEDRLDELDRLEKEGKTGEIARIKESAPYAIPDTFMRKLLEMLLAWLVGNVGSPIAMHQWGEQLARWGLTPATRHLLQDLLSPRIVIEPKLRWLDEAPASEPTPEEALSVELHCAADDIASWLHGALESDPDLAAAWRAALPSLLPMFSGQLEAGLDLLRELGKAGDREDRSHWDLPSISPHEQNRGARNWTVLIELVRDAWLELLEDDAARAREIALAWFSKPYPAFKRLALFAANRHPDIPGKVWVGWLTEDDCRWLWSIMTQREVCQLLAEKGAALPDRHRHALERAILQGPPREMFKKEISEEEWRSIQDHSIWLRLGKLLAGGAKLRPRAQKKLDDLSRKYPRWQIAKNERDEFTIWVSGSGDPDFEARRIFHRAPASRDELAVWLIEDHPDKASPFKGNIWRQVCQGLDVAASQRAQRIDDAVHALNVLAKRGIWPADRWQEALRAWAHPDPGDDAGNLAKQVSDAVAPLLEQMPGEEFEQCVRDVSQWLDAWAEALDLEDQHQVALFTRLSRRVLELYGGASASPAGELSQMGPVNDAFNHPAGHITRALVTAFFNRERHDNEGLAELLKSLFSYVCAPDKPALRAGRVILSMNLLPLFRVDPDWTRDHLLRWFKWDCHAEEASACWQGFLTAPRIYLPLLEEIREDFLETAAHYPELGDRGDQYVALLTHIALSHFGVFSEHEIRRAFEQLPGEALVRAARILAQNLEAAGARRADYWENRVKPFWQKYWPKWSDRVSPPLAEQLALMAIAAGPNFPSALDMVEDWLVPPELPYGVVRALRDSGLCKEHPEPAVRLLGKIIGEGSRVLWEDVRECLEAAGNAEPALKENPIFQRLEIHVRQHSRTR